MRLNKQNQKPHKKFSFRSLKASVPITHVILWIYKFLYVYEWNQKWKMGWAYKYIYMYGDEGYRGRMSQRILRLLLYIAIMASHKSLRVASNFYHSMIFFSFWLHLRLLYWHVHEMKDINHNSWKTMENSANDSTLNFSLEVKF